MPQAADSTDAAGSWEAYLSTQSGSPSIYQLAFHLPYYAWRSSADIPKSSLSCQGIDVSFLNSIQPENDFIYSGQISCVVTGTSRDKSTVYMLVENRFDNEDSIDHIEQLNEEVNYEFCYDPFTRKFSTTDQPVYDPEELFLLLLRARLGHINIEWIKIIARLQQSFRTHDPILVCYILASGLHYRASFLFIVLTSDQARLYRSSAPPEPKTLGETAALEWDRQVESLLMQLTDCLSMTVEVIENFWSRYRTEIQYLSDAAKTTSYQLPDLETLLTQITSTNCRLEKMVKRYKSIAQRSSGPSRTEVTEPSDSQSTQRQPQVIAPGKPPSQRLVEVSYYNQGLTVIMAVSCRKT